MIPPRREHTNKRKAEKMNKPGFAHNGRVIYFIDGHGKDASFERWRAILYYATNYAETHFLDSEAEYTRFIEDRSGFTYHSYEGFRADAERTGLRNSL